MGTIYSAFETKIRADLSDPAGGSQLLSAADIDRHVDHAAADLSLIAPITSILAVNATPSSRVISLSAALTGLNLVRVLAVEWPTAAFPKNWVQWELYGNQLTMLVATAPSGADAVNVYARIAMVAGATAPVSTIPGEYDELIARRAVGYAAQEMAARLMNQINIGGPLVWEHYLTLSVSVLDNSDVWLNMLAQRPLFFAGRLHAPQFPPQGWSETGVNPPEEVFP